MALVYGIMKRSENNMDEINRMRKLVTKIKEYQHDLVDTTESLLDGDNVDFIKGILFCLETLNAKLKEAVE